MNDYKDQNLKSAMMSLGIFVSLLIGFVIFMFVS